MSTELTLVATADEIATLPVADRAVMVTHALIESKQWLAVATKGTDPTPIKEFKAWAATVAEMTKQKGLASEIQADALEMLRRAERGIGQAVRNGQEAGEIAKRGDSSASRRHLEGDEVKVKRLPDIGLSYSDMSGTGSSDGYYAMTDNVTDEQFEEALTEAREEGNLSRANVVRKIKGKPSKRTREQLADEIAAHALSGMASPQIAKKVGVGEEWVRQTAREFDIDIPADRVVGKTRRIDPIRVARETVMALDGLASTVDLVSDLAGLDPREAAQWTASLDQSIRALNQLNKKIKEAVL